MSIHMVDSSGHGRHARRRGAILALVMVVVSVSMVGGVTWLIKCAVSADISVLVLDQARARQIAESGLALGMSYIDRTPTWRDDRSSGVWIESLDLLEGAVTVEASFVETSPSEDALSDASFEESVGALPTPLLNPPMSGVIGGWEVMRTALVPTGLTVPTIRVEMSAESTDGANLARIGFGASVVGTAVIGQELATELRPNHLYEVTVAITASHLLHIDSSCGFRVLAGSTLVASTDQALALDTLPQEEILQQAEALLTGASEPATLVTFLLAGTTSEYTLRFLTDDDPPPGLMRLELFAESIGLLSWVAFDNVRWLSQSNEPVEMTSTGQCGVATHRSRALVHTTLGGARIIQWSEP